jgi:hypothetical protein
MVNASSIARNDWLPATAEVFDDLLGFILTPVCLMKCAPMGSLCSGSWEWLCAVAARVSREFPDYNYGGNCRMAGAGWQVLKDAGSDCKCRGIIPPGSVPYY